MKTQTIFKITENNKGDLMWFTEELSYLEAMGLAKYLKQVAYDIEKSNREEN